MAKNYRIAVIAGDGIGREVMPEGIAAMEAAARAYGFGCQWHEFDWSCERYVNMGLMMPEDGLERLRLYDAVYLGAVGHPEVPDHVSLWGLLIPLRRGCWPACNHRCATARRATSISMSCATTMRANIRKSAAGCMPAASLRWQCRKPSLRN